MDTAFLEAELKWAIRDGLLTIGGDLVDPLRAFIHKTRYAKWREHLLRYETWVETVQRYMTSIQFILLRDLKYVPEPEQVRRVYHAILHQEVMPSMRCMYSAGPALEKDCTYGYNCAFIAVDTFKRFGECMYLMMCGAGVGYSVRMKHICQLPVVADALSKQPIVVKVEDSREGWAKAVDEYVELLYKGVLASVDVSEVRPAGSPLKTSGGRSQGPAPLLRYLDQLTVIFRGAVGRRLTSVEVHDCMTMVNDVIVNGGGRRGALISIFDHDDLDMINCKSAAELEKHPNRQYANNSACYPKGVTRTQYDTLFDPLISAGSGEPGIFNLPALRKLAAVLGRRDPKKIKGCNPCGEIALDSELFCNLSEMIIRHWDTLATLTDKAEVAAIIGTWQSGLTSFPGLNPNWKAHCEDERLLGVSMSGLFDCSVTNPSKPGLPEVLAKLRKVTWDVNSKIAAEMGINPSVAVTTVKPSGTVSLLTGVSYGVHPWHSPYFIRSFRVPTAEPMCRLLKASGLRNEVAVNFNGTPNPGTTVFFLPRKAPEGATTIQTLSALDHFEAWKLYKVHWTDHNPSVTINVKPHEWQDIKEAVWRDIGIVGGLSFFPYEEHFYKQPVYDACTKEVYDRELAAAPKTVDFNDLWKYTKEEGENGSADSDTRRRRIKDYGATELACSGGVCATGDLV